MLGNASAFANERLLAEAAPKNTLAPFDLPPSPPQPLSSRGRGDTDTDSLYSSGSSLTRLSARSASQSMSGYARPPGYVRVGAKLPFRRIRGPNELNAEWLTHVFRWKGYLGPSGSVTSLETRQLGEGQGAFGDLMLVTITCDGARPDAPMRFVAKFSPRKAVSLPKVAVKAAFTNEAHFYNIAIAWHSSMP
jgi:hypothetical protein